MTIENYRTRASLVAAVLLLTGCGGGGEAGRGEDGGAEPGRETRGGAAHGLPVTEPTGPVDEALAEQGERAFQARGCVACHTVGRGRLVGPDLAGVTERRTFEWFYHMVTNPDSMTRNDPTARRLLGEYMTPMLDQNATPEEVRTIWEYVRGETDEDADERGEADGPGGA